MNHYYFGSFVLESLSVFHELVSLPPELLKQAGTVADYRFQIITVPPKKRLITSKDLPFQTRNYQDGETEIAFYRKNKIFILDFPRYGTFWVDKQEKSIECLPNTTTPMHTVRHLFLDTVFPFVVSLDGYCVLHASVVSLENRAIAFVGKSGAGKSSLAGHFTKRGWELLSDDCLFLKSLGSQYYAVPSYPSLRLWPDSYALLFQGHDSSPVAHYNEKKRISLLDKTRADCTPIPLEHIILLDPCAVSSTRRAKVMTLIESSFLLDIQDEATISKHFREVSNIVHSIPVSGIDYEKSFEGLEKAFENVLSKLTNNATCSL